MTSDNRIITIANGAEHLLYDVAAHLALLETNLEDADQRHLVVGLRNLCLGKELSDIQRKSIQKAGLLMEDGSVAPTMKDVVLTCLRGEDENLRLVSPYTSRDDRLIGEFLSLRERFLRIYPEPEVDRLFAHTPLKQVLMQWGAHLQGERQRPDCGPARS